jgi:hypothetical protein
MKFTQCSITGENDLRTMENLARQSRAEKPHVSDLPYRFEAWALEDPENISLWMDFNG